MEYNLILNELKKKIFHPIYFLYGEEPFFIDRLIAYMEDNILDEANAAFGRHVLYGRDVNTQNIIDLARGFPMMGDYQLIIVKEAQDLMKIENLEAYFKSPTPSTILVIGYKYKKIDKRKTFYKILTKNNDFVMFESAKLYENKIPGWIDNWVKHLGYRITPKADILLAEHLGTDLSRINNELEKLGIILKHGEVITEDHVEQHIGISKEFNIFELQKALGFRDAYKALRIVRYFKANPKQNPMVMVAPLLYSFFVKVLLYQKNSKLDKYKLASVVGVSPYFLTDYSMSAQNFSTSALHHIIGMIKILDLKNKGVDTSSAGSYGPLEEFVMRICG